MTLISDWHLLSVTGLRSFPWLWGLFMCGACLKWTKGSINQYHSRHRREGRVTNFVVDLELLNILPKAEKTKTKLFFFLSAQGNHTSIFMKTNILWVNSTAANHVARPGGKGAFTLADTQNDLFRIRPTKFDKTVSPFSSCLIISHYLPEQFTYLPWYCRCLNFHFSEHFQAFLSMFWWFKVFYEYENSSWQNSLTTKSIQ